MKTLFTTLAVILALSTSVFASGDLPVLNEQNIQKFIQILPEYKQIISKYQENLSPEEAVPTTSKVWTAVNALLSKYGISAEEFPLLAQKIMMGFAAVQMEQTDMGAMSGMLNNLPQFKSVTTEEKALLKKYMDQLKEVFETE